MISFAPYFQVPPSTDQQGNSKNLLVEFDAVESRRAVACPSLHVLHGGPQPFINEIPFEFLSQSMRKRLTTIQSS
jgi:hypothetical protein